MNKRKQLEVQKKLKEHQRKIFLKRISALIISMIIIIVGIVIYFHVSNSNINSSNTDITATSISWGSFTKISDYNSANVKIYYFSWYGCPIGATDSWEFYNVLSNYGNISGYVSTHYSDPNDLYPNTPGLIFTESFSIGGISFHPVYVYNQYMNATTSGAYISPQKLLSTGISEINSTVPHEIAHFEYFAMYTIPTSYFGKPSGVENGHINTNVIIVRPNGTWILNGPLFNPIELAGLNPTALLHDPESNSHIAETSQTVLSYI